MSTRRLRSLLVASSLVVLTSCSGTSSRTVGSEGAATTSTSVAAATTTVLADVTSTVAVTGAPSPAPAPTAPPATAAPATATASTGPKVVSATFNGPSACPAPDVSLDLPTPSVSISWVATNADSVYVSIDNPYGPYEQNLPLTGSISDLPFGCPGSHTYYVVAIKGTERDLMSKTFTAN